MFGRVKNRETNKTYAESIEELRNAINSCDAVVVGAGAGLSTAAGYLYSGEVFDTYFGDFKDKYGIRDIYSGGFYPFPSLEEYWAWWSRHIWLNRYSPIPSGLYESLLHLMKDKDYFVITTNVDHCFQRAGFDKQRLFYTQGDYGLFQSRSPRGASHGKTYDNKDIVREMLLSQGFMIASDDTLVKSKTGNLKMVVATELIPYCPDDGKEMVPNLRCDDTFVEDEGWHKASERYSEFIQRHEGLKVLFLELGVGGNTPVIIKYPFWQYTARNKKAVYACINKDEAFVPDEIIKQSVCIDDDIAAVLRDLESA